MRAKRTICWSGVGAALLGLLIYGPARLPATRIGLNGEPQQDIALHSLAPSARANSQNAGSYASYFGAGADDAAYAVAHDSAGNIYIAGSTASTNLPATTGAYKTSFNGGSFDAFVAKFTAAGVPVYVTYLGGSGDDEAYGVAVDSQGNAYVTGYTDSADFPTSAGAYKRTKTGGKDIFVAKIDPTGASLVYSTYVGGSDDDVANGIAIDSSGAVYLAGFTASANLPVSSTAFQKTKGGAYDAFALKLNGAGTALDYCTYLGGSSDDLAYGVAVDSSGNAYLTGYTQSSNFPTSSGARQSTLNGITDAFVVALNSTGSGVAYSTYLGGGGADLALGIALDSSGNAYVAGYTSSADFPVTTAAYQKALAGGNDFFVSKLTPTGSLSYATYIGGKGDDYGQALAVTSDGSVFVTGYSNSTDYPMTGGALRAANAGNSDVVISKLDAAGSVLPFSTYLGGSGFETGYGLAVTGSGDVLATGYTLSPDFPVSSNAQSTQIAGGADAFLVKFTPLVASFLTKVSGDSQAALIGSALAAPVVVTVADQFGNAMPNVAVTWQVTSGGGSISGGTFTASGGQCQATWTLGETAGTNTLTASVSGLASVAFSAAASNPLPAISQLSPASVAAGGAAFTLTVTGTGFVSGAIVKWDGAERPTAFVSATKVTAGISASDFASTGTVQVTVTNPAPGGGSSTAVNFTIASPITYLVGDVAPLISAQGDLNADGTYLEAGEFGDDALNIIDLIFALRAVTGIPGYKPDSCTDRFDAMDSYPVDAADQRGGDGTVNILDLIISLRRVTGVDASRPRRASRGVPCPAQASSAVAPQSSALPSQQEAEGVIEFGRAISLGRGRIRVPVYLFAQRQLELAGLAFSLSVTEANYRYLPAGSSFAATLVDSETPGLLGLAWLNGLSVSAGERLLLGYLEVPSRESGRGSPPQFGAYGIAANARDGRRVAVSIANSSASSNR